MTNKIDWQLLKKLYAIHSPSGREDKMIKFLCSLLKSFPGVKLGKDTLGNLYAWKGEAESYPCIVAHLDQVQHEHSRNFKAVETRDLIFGYSPSNHGFQGLGADDKNGILIAIEALRNYDCMKAAFFRQEETGCIGSQNAEMSFFDNCRYVIQCDRRGNSDMITSIGFTDLCSEDFIQAVEPENWGYREENGMMTDVETLKENGLKVSAINLSCGYYNPHTDEEITIKRDLLKCWRMVQHIIEDCTEIYPHEQSEYYGRFRCGYDDWEMEDEIFSTLHQDPTLTASDLYEAYHADYPHLTLNDFENIASEYRMMYELEEDDETTNETIKENEKDEIKFKK